MDVAASQNDPPAYLWLVKFLPATVMVNTFANFFTLFITLGAYGPARRFWNEFEVFIALAWLFFLIALTFGIIAQMILTFQRHHVVDAFGRGRDGYRKWRDGGMGDKSWSERLAVAFIVKVPIAFIISMLMLFGLMFCSLCVVSHCLAVGWIGFVWTVLMMVLAVIAWVLAEHA